MPAIMLTKSMANNCLIVQVLPPSMDPPARRCRLQARPCCFMRATSGVAFYGSQPCKMQSTAQTTG